MLAQYHTAKEEQRWALNPAWLGACALNHYATAFPRSPVGSTLPHTLESKIVTPPTSPPTLIEPVLCARDYPNYFIFFNPNSPRNLEVGIMTPILQMRKMGLGDVLGFVEGCRAEEVERPNQSAGFPTPLPVASLSAHSFNEH